MSSRFERTGGTTRYEGKIFSVREETFRHEDGDESTREIVRHQGAVGVVCHDGERIWLVRQPREAVGAPDLLELPAGKLDVEGEEPLETAKRELAEEIGKAAEAALRACGYEPRRIVTGGGSDANALEGMLDVALALLDGAAAV